jgi:23S rRNA (guanosine2251-2'-O)-methyltransferase
VEKYLQLQIKKMENFIFGLHPVNEAIKSGKEIDKVLVKKNLTGNIALKLVSEIRQQGITIQYVPQEKLDKICKHNHQGIIAYVSPIKYQNLEEVIIKVQDENKTPLIIILDGVTDVRNFGAIARSCECAGASAIVIPTSGSVRISDEAIKTSAGALYNIPICKVENLIDAVLLLNQMNIEVVAVSEKAERLIYELDLTTACALILGAEDKGISNSLIKRADKKAKIPLYGKTSSLNVSVSAALAVYEAIRQRMNSVES